MAGLLGEPLGGGWRRPPPYETIADEQAAAMAPRRGLADLFSQHATTATRSVMPGDQPGMPEMPTNIRQPKAFGRGGKGWQIVGLIGDALQAAGGGKGTYLPYIAEQQQMESRAREKLLEIIEARRQKAEDRTAALEDWKVKEQWQRDNPAPVSDARTLEWWQSLPEDQKRAYAEMQDVRQPIAVTGPQGTERVPRMYGRPSGRPQFQDVDGRKVVNIGGQWYEVTE